VPAIPDKATTSPQDGMLQVYVPAGEFKMGNRSGGSDPSHIVFLDSYWMDRVEVTNAMYKLCVSAKACSLPADDNTAYHQWSYRDHPVTYITWFQAEAYCQWAGRRLPTEAEWGKAARGTDERRYPWGNAPPNARLANFDGTMIHEALSSFRYALGASPYGVLNMSGNVREWVADWYDPNYYYVLPTHTVPIQELNDPCAAARTMRIIVRSQYIGAIATNHNLRA
jgi:formylglycine-generating enzyme required for sulfatase activity